MIEGRVICQTFEMIEHSRETFAKVHGDEMWARFQFLLFEFNTGYLSRLVTTLLYSVVTIVGGLQIVHNYQANISTGFVLGDLVLLLSTINNFSTSLKGFCIRLANVGKGFLGVQLLADFLNADTILSQRLHAAQEENSTEQQSSTNLEDMRLFCANVGCKTELRGGGLIWSPLVSADFELDNFNVIVGGKTEGKTTLLKVLAGLVVPTTGHYNRPEQLHYRYIEDGRHTMCTETIYDCINYGCKSPHARCVVVRTARMFGVFDTKEYESDEWLDLPPQTLTYVQRAKIALIRAVLSNGDVLLLNGTLDQIDRESLSTLADGLGKWRAHELEHQPMVSSVHYYSYICS